MSHECCSFAQIKCPKHSQNFRVKSLLVILVNVETRNLSPRNLDSTLTLSKASGRQNSIIYSQDTFVGFQPNRLRECLFGRVCSTKLQQTASSTEPGKLSAWRDSREPHSRRLLGVFSNMLLPESGQSRQCSRISGVHAQAEERARPLCIVGRSPRLAEIARWRAEIFFEKAFTASCQFLLIYRTSSLCA